MHGSAQLCRFVPVLRSTLSLRSCAPLNFDDSLLWLHSASSLPDRLLNTQITPLRNFDLLCTSAGLKKKAVFEWQDINAPRYSLRQPDLLFLQIFSLPCGDVLLLRIRAVCVILSASVDAMGWRLRFAGGPPSQTFFIVTLARNRVNDRDWEQRRKGKDLFWLELEQAASFKGHVRRTFNVCRVYWFVDKRSIRVDCWIWNLFT